MALLKLDNLPRKDVLVHLVDKPAGGFYDDEFNMCIDGALPGGGVTQSYVDGKDAETLAAAKKYTDDELAKAQVTKLYTGYGDNEDGAVTQKFFTEEMGKKQDTLVSGANIKTVNGQELVGSGNVEIDATGELITVEEFNNIWEQA